MSNSKYGESIARIDERTELILKRLDDQNASQSKQWDLINQNCTDIEVLKEQQSSWTKGVTALSAIVSAAVSGAISALAWFGIKK